MQCILSFNHNVGLITVCFNLYLGTPTVSLPTFKFEEMCKVIQDFKIIIIANHTVVDKIDLSSLEHIPADAAPVP
jgi:hypothetical protein